MSARTLLAWAAAWLASPTLAHSQEILVGPRARGMGGFGGRARSRGMRAKSGYPVDSDLVHSSSHLRGFRLEKCFLALLKKGSGLTVETHPSVCPLDCPDACSLEVNVDHGRVTGIDGSRRNPLTQAFICAKVRRYARHVYGSERLLHPGVRRGKKGEGEFSSVSWDEALNLVAERMRRSAGEAILPFSYGGSNGFLSQDTTDARLFRRLGASRLARTVCAAPSSRAAVGLYGKMPGVVLTDYVHARLIVVWGANPAVSGIHLMPIIQQARARGASLAVVDPRRTKLAQQADLHLALRPGTDVVVALAVIRWLFAEGAADLKFLAAHADGVERLRERAQPWTLKRAAEVADVRPGDIEAFARRYAETTPAVIRSGWGLERNRNGGSAVAAVLALPAVAGKFGVRGGGYTMSQSGAWNLNAEAVIGEPEPPTRVINMNRLGRGLRTAKPPIELLFVYNANPLATLPDQENVRAGLLREGLFTVVFEQVMTDTARYADVVLPAATFLERAELCAGYGAMVLQASDAVIAPVGESRSNHEVFAELCRRTGVARPGEPESEEAFARAIVGDREELRAGGITYPTVGPDPIQFVNSFPLTPDRKIHLFPEDLDRESPQGLYGYREDPASEPYPLALISPASDRTISSTLGQLRREHVKLEIHPVDAASRGIRDGDRVRVFNAQGEVHCFCRINADLRPGVAYLPKGLWSHNTLNGTTANALVPDALTDLGGGACFNDARVQVVATALDPDRRM
ncbi:MAG: molybdopterin-dependent oxidoreductase [Planctomycetes bacterium]|nr:molybdopterin-dependent oxidoreductase [Planctomycetota bacterium]